MVRLLSLEEAGPNLLKVSESTLARALRSEPLAASAGALFTAGEPVSRHDGQAARLTQIKTVPARAGGKSGWDRYSNAARRMAPASIRLAASRSHTRRSTLAGS